jgi:hypothetical protein
MSYYGPGSRGGDQSYDELLTAKVEVNLSDFEAVMRLADMSLDKVRKAAGLKTPTTVYKQRGREMIAAAVVGMDRFANEVMVDSLAECPEDSGTLKESHDVLPPTRVGNRIKIEIGYGYGDQPSPVNGRRASQYALPVHEIWYAEHEPPTKSHFLIDPLMLHASRFGPGLAAVMRSHLRGERVSTTVVGGEGEAFIIPGPAGAITDVSAYGGGRSVRGPGGRFTGAVGSRVAGDSPLNVGLRNLGR